MMNYLKRLDAKKDAIQTFDTSSLAKNYNTKILEIKKKILDHNRSKYFTT